MSDNTILSTENMMVNKKYGPYTKIVIVYWGRKTRCVNKGCQASPENRVHSPSNGGNRTQPGSKGT